METNYTVNIIATPGDDYLTAVDIRTLNADKLADLRREAAEAGDLDLIATIDSINTDAILITAQKHHDMVWGTLTNTYELAVRSLDARIIGAARLLWQREDGPIIRRTRTGGTKVIVTTDQALALITARIDALTIQQMLNLVSGHTRPGQKYGTDSYYYSRDEKVRAEIIAGTTVRIMAARQAIGDAREALEEHEAAYTGWNRYVLCLSPRGHVHSSHRCSSLRPTSSIALLDVLSGETVETVLAEVGGGLCSKCYPTAPVEHTGFVGTKRGGEIAARYSAAKEA